VSPRRAVIAGNWKMNLSRVESVALARSIATRSEAFPQLDLVVCPPSVYLHAVGGELAGSRVALGAQNMSPEPHGAYTGEISAAMLRDVGCRWVIVGHSERRQLMGETDAAVQRKSVAALAAGLTPIVCVGETLDQRESGQTAAVIRGQFDGSLAGMSPEQAARMVIAYEPVWAIGTGRVASPEQAQEVHADLRKLLAHRYNDDVSGVVRILYGGSVNPENAASLLRQPDIDGALVGGASLKAESFLAIAAAA
jgi:triosephosphate isomerase